MVRRLRDFDKWDIYSSEGDELGKVDDFYFDDELWTVRYLVVQTGSWLTGRSVLVSPMAIERLSWDNARFDLTLTVEQIKGAPDADLAQPLSRQWEARHSGYYALPYYWAGPGLWGAWKTPLAARESAEATRPTAPVLPRDQHLRSAREVTGYHIHARDGEIGHVENFLVDDQSWTIRYLMVDTSNWIGGRTVLVAPEWTSRVDWPRQEVHVDVTRHAVKESPEYHPGAEVDREFDERLAEVHKHPLRRF